MHRQHINDDNQEKKLIPTKKYPRNRVGLIERAIKATQFLNEIGHRTFSRGDLGDAIGVSQSSAHLWLDALSLHYPIQTVRDVRSCGRYGKLPELFRVE